MIEVTHETFCWFLIAYVVAVYLFDWAVDWIWFRFVDWYIARTEVRRRQFEKRGDASLGNRERRTEDQARLTGMGPARRRHSLPRTGRAVA